MQLLKATGVRNRNKHFIATRNILFKIHDTVIEFIFDSNTQHKADIKVNGQLTAVTSDNPYNTQIGGNCQLSIKKRKKHVFKVISKEIGFTGRVTVMTAYMRLALKCDYDFVCQFIPGGFCGEMDCAKYIGTQMDRCGIAVIEGEKALTITDNFDVNTDISSVSLTESLTGSPVTITGAGNKICMDDSSMIVTHVNKCFLKRETTIAMYVQFNNPAESYGSIFSFTGWQKTFALRYSNLGHLYATYGSEKFDFKNHIPDVGEWNEIFIAWKHIIGELCVYLLKAGDKLVKECIVTGSDMVFQSAGSLAVGRWQVPKVPGTDQEEEKFKGCMDELRIWDR